jgi:hypothetical protein
VNKAKKLHVLRVSTLVGQSDKKQTNQLLFAISAMMNAKAEQKGGE